MTQAKNDKLWNEKLLGILKNYLSQKIVVIYIVFNCYNLKNNIILILLFFLNFFLNLKILFNSCFYLIKV